MFSSVSTLERRIAPKIALSPSQHKAAEGVLQSLERGDCAVLQDYGSDGKTTVLDYVQKQIGGARMGAREFLAKLASLEPAAIEEAFLSLIDSKMAEHDLLIIDDLHLIQNIVQDCEYPRRHLLDAVLTAALTEIAAAGKKVLCATDDIPDPLARRAHAFAILDFTAADFEVICSAYLDPGAARRVDFAEIHRFAPSLSAHQLRKAAVWLSHESGVCTARFCEYLNVHNLVSNVEVAEVEPVTWNDLKGVDDVIEALETKIALPFEHRDLAASYNLKPKRGVLLAGPPGTGKTTIGRALAHRLKGKFFLVDGTMIAGSGSFYTEIDRVFTAAERNAPAVVFIDDADVIFGGEKESGLYRYLLTKLDGLESAKAGRICVMMTAMEPRDLPGAILRSGRVELWLETRLPDAAARADIFRSKLASLPAPLCSADFVRLAAASRGCTGADIKAIVEDGKLEFAHDQITRMPPRPVDEYFVDAIAAVRRNRRNYHRRKPALHPEGQHFGFKRT